MGNVDLEPIVGPVVESAGLELVEVVLGREDGRKVLRVTVDREGGVDLDTIAVTSNMLSRRLDLEGFSPDEHYSLEVSSPGLERPLRAPRDFLRKVGDTVRVKVLEPEPATVQGKLVAADDDGIVVTTDAGELRIGYEQVASAKTVFEWGEKS